MVNSHLLRKLVETPGLHESDRQEIINIFEILPDVRKIAILDDWETIVTRIRASRERLEREKEILLVRAVEEMETGLARYEEELASMTG